MSPAHEIRGALFGTLGLMATAAWGAAIDQRLPVNAPQCALGQFAPGIVTPDNGYDGAGPTDVNAETANGRLAVGVNRRGTITVFRWPHPSHYNQIKYFTFDRSKPYFGAYPNEGAFLGVVVVHDGVAETRWLRDFPSSAQRYAGPAEDLIVTTFTDSQRGIEATVEGVAAWDRDVLVQRVRVSAINPEWRPQALVAFENLNLVVSKFPGLPGQDWCLAEQNVDAARYDGDADAIIHEKAGVDVSTADLSSVAVAMGFASVSSGHQVGGDAFEPTAGPAGMVGPILDAFLDAGDGSLTGNDRYAGQTTGALETPLLFDEGGAASAEVYFAAAPSATEALATLASARAGGFQTLAEQKRSKLQSLLADAPLPETTDQKVRELAERALVVLVTTASPQGPIVAAITNQPPYAEDWLRDGSFINHALDVAGLHDFVTRHNLFYASVQATARKQPSGSLGVPPGNWSMNYYDDGVNGGPIPWEIDETGFGAWTLWDHYTFTCDTGYLARVYPAIRRAADFLVACRDLQNGLQCHGTEDDNFAIGQQQTVHGAASTWVALQSALAAAKVLGSAADATRYQARLDQLGPAIDSVLWDATKLNYGGTYDFGSWIIWPALFHVEPTDPLHDRILDQASYLWSGLANAFQAPFSGPASARYEGKGLLSLAELSRHDPAANYLDRVKQGLHWIAYIEATPDTGLLGETWFVDPSGPRVITNTGIPHLWEHTLFYLSALSAYGTPISPPPCAP